MISHEPKGVDFIIHPEILSRRFPVKTMFLGVVKRSRPDYNFDEKILSEIVSKIEIINKRIAHNFFTDDAIINSKLKVR